MSKFKKAIKRALRITGLNVSKFTPSPTPFLLHHKVELLLDVGANIGQFAQEKRTEGFKGKIVSFEPLPDAHNTLLKISQQDPLWIIHKRCALGSSIGETEINISQNSFSSSILPMLQKHSTAAPNSLYIGKAKTEILTIDSIFNLYHTGGGEKTFLKIDTQGFEAEVIIGASNSLENIIGVQLECSIVPLYENQYLYKHFFTFFEDNGFTLWSLIPGFFDPKTGQYLQFDAVFIRDPKPNL